MNEIKYVITTNTINLFIDDESYSFIKGSPQFICISELINKGEIEKVREVLSKDGSLKELAKNQIEEDGDKIYLRLSEDKKWQVPENLASRIFDHIGKGLKIDIWVQFAQKLMNNPSDNSVNQLFGFLEKNKFTITETGNFLAYKRVRGDFKDIYTGKMDNSIGTIVKMARSQVNDNPDQTCSAGLHVAAYHYAAHVYGSSTLGDDKLLYVEVDPANVVSVPIDYNNQKMRVCEYKVLGICEHEFAESCYSDNQGFYDEDWADEEYEEVHFD